jgi:ELWxxDGT repeat protein
MVVDLAPGTTSSQITQITSVGERIIFKLRLNNTLSLWSSDATADGTFRLLNANALESWPDSIDLPFPTAGSFAYFIVNASSTRVWRTDGTLAGTTMLMDVAPPIYFDGMFAAEDALYFRLFVGNTTPQIWRVDDNLTQPTLFSDSFWWMYGSLGRFKGKEYFSIADHRGAELWESDGTEAGSHLIKDINTRVIASNPYAAKEIDDKLFILTGSRLWVTNTAQTTYTPLRVLRGLPDYSDGGVNLAGRFVFTHHGTKSLWTSDGTASGTLPLKSFSSLLPGSGPRMIVHNGLAIFIAQGTQLWRTDGTPQGTLLVQELGADASNIHFVRFGNAIYFATGADGQPQVLWKTDGTPDGTAILHPSIHHIRSSDIAPAAVFQNKLFFSACDAAGCQLWTSDGSGPATLFADVQSPSDFTISNGFLFFVSGSRLYKTDGAPNSVILVKDFTGSYSPPNHLIDLHGTLFFILGESQFFQSLMKSDGTTAGTVVVASNRQINAPAPFKVIDRRLFYQANGGIWHTDGGPPSSQFQVTVSFPPPQMLLERTVTGLYLRSKEPIGTLDLYKVAPPIPRTTGPYTVGIGSSTILDATASSDTTTLSWDLDNDGIFGEVGAAAANGDEVTSSPTFFANNLSPGIHPVTLKVANSFGLSDALTIPITIRDANIIGTPGNDSWRISLLGNLVRFYENITPGPPTFSIPLDRIPMIRITGLGGNDTVTLEAALPINLDLGPGNDTLILTAGAHQLDTQQNFDNLILSNSASLKLGFSPRFSTLSITNTATLDLTTHSLILDTASLSSINNLIRTGRITTSTPTPNHRLAAIINQNPTRPSFAGHTVTGNEILVHLALTGDLNFDNQVTIADFLTLSANFNQSPATWANGDINDDSAITIADFLLLSANFGQSYSTATIPNPALSTTSTPNLPTKRKLPARKAIARLHHRPLNRFATPYNR